eukprot:6081728-Prymnesium_polylepis.2
MSTSRGTQGGKCHPGAENRRPPWTDMERGGVASKHCPGRRRPQSHQGGGCDVARRWHCNLRRMATIVVQFAECSGELEEPNHGAATKTSQRCAERAARDAQSNSRSNGHGSAAARGCGQVYGLGWTRRLHRHCTDQFVGAEKAKDDLHELTADEIGAMFLYTTDSPLYPKMNELQRSYDRTGLKVFFSYLRLLLTAHDKLPKFAGSVWRGVKGVDLRSRYPTGEKSAWWAFSSTSKKLDTLLDPTFLGQTGVRTIFMIEVKSGIDVVPYSAFADTEAEVLLFPGFVYEVVSTIDLGSSLYQVHLREIEMPVSAALMA